MKLIRTAQVLFVLDVFLWLSFGVFALLWLSQDHPGENLWTWLLLIAVMGNSAALLLSAVLLGKGRKLFYYFACGVLIINIIGTMMDQLGIYDYAFLLFELILLAILLMIRKHYT